MNPTAVCDECEKVFGILPYTKYNKDVHETWFNCPHCKHPYFAYATNERVRDNQGKIQRLIKTTRYITDKQFVDKQHKKVNRLRHENKKIMNKLKKNIV